MSGRSREIDNDTLDGSLAVPLPLNLPSEPVLSLEKSTVFTLDMFPPFVTVAVAIVVVGGDDDIVDVCGDDDIVDVCDADSAVGSTGGVALDLAPSSWYGVSEFLRTSITRFFFLSYAKLYMSLLIDCFC